MKTRLKEAASGCCAPAQANNACCPPEAPTGQLTTDAVITFKDRLAHLRCRSGSFRTRYTVLPGLWAIGNPGKDSEVFVTANYAMSFNRLRSSLAGVDAWILVLDTKGINVWCAAGKGTFGTDELVKKIFSTKLFSVVTHRRLILPQLGAPGVAAHEVRRQTGFRVLYGPVEASDLKAFLDAGYKATPQMRKVGFGIVDRIILTPMEIRPAMKGFLIFALIVLAVTGINSFGISWDKAVDNGLPLVFLGAVSVMAGAFLTPVLLPWVPFRSFALKGYLVGLVSVLAALRLKGGFPGLYLDAASVLFFPLVSSYVALQFTGSTVYTGISGVRKELRWSLPVYVAGTVVSFALLAAFKAGEWGLL